MLGLVLLFLGLSLLIVAVIAWLGCRTARSAPARALPAPLIDGHDLLPEADYAGGEDRLALFYTYQMALSRINRV